MGVVAVVEVVGVVDLAEVVGEHWRGGGWWSATVAPRSRRETPQSCLVTHRCIVAGKSEHIHTFLDNQAPQYPLLQCHAKIH